LAPASSRTGGSQYHSAVGGGALSRARRCSDAAVVSCETDRQAPDRCFACVKIDTVAIKKLTYACGFAPSMRPHHMQLRRLLLLLLSQSSNYRQTDGPSAQSLAIGLRACDRLLYVGLGATTKHGLVRPDRAVSPSHCSHAGEGSVMDPTVDV